MKEGIEKPNLNQSLTKNQKVGLLNEYQFHVVLEELFPESKGYRVESNDFNNYASCQKKGVDHMVYFRNKPFLAIEDKGWNMKTKPYGSGKAEKEILSRFADIDRNVPKISLISYHRLLTKKDYRFLLDNDVESFEVGTVLTSKTSQSFLNKLKYRLKYFLTTFKNIFMSYFGRFEDFLAEEGINVNVDELVNEFNVNTIDKIITTSSLHTDNILTNNKLTIDELTNTKLNNKHDMGNGKVISVKALESKNNRIRDTKKLEKLKELKQRYKYLLRIPESWIV